MAISATFVARFDSFFEQVQKADAKLGEFEMSSKSVQKSLDRLTSSFSGDKIIADATLVAKAVEGVGGAAALTDKEAARVNRTMAEAIEKMQKLGQTAPAGWHDLAKATETAGQKTSLYGKITQEVSGIAKTAATAFVGMFAIEKLTSFVSGVVNLGGELTDLSAKTGLSTTALQQFKYAGGQVGVSLDAITGGVNQLQKRLAGDDKSATGAVAALGLSLNALKGMKPEEQFRAIADKVGAIEDPMLRTKAATDLFGKSGAELLPVLTKEFGELTDKANSLGIVMDEQTVAAMDNLGDTVSDLGSVAMAALGRIITPLIPLLSAVAEVAMKLASVLGDVLGWTVDKVTMGLKWLANALLDTTRNMLIGLRSTMDAVPGLNKMTGASDGLSWAIGKLDAMQASLNAKTPEVTKQTQLAGAEFKVASKAATDHAEAVRKVAESYQTTGLNESQKVLVDGLRGIGSVSKLSSDAQKKLAADVADLMSAFKNLGIDAPKHIVRIYDETVKLVTLPEVVKKSMKEANAEARKLQDDMVKQSVKAANDLFSSMLQKNADALKSAKVISDQFVEAFGSAYDKAIAKADEFRTESLKNIAPLKISMPAVFADSRARIEAIYASMVADAKAAASKTVSWWSSSFEALPSAILDAVKGGGSIVNTITSIFSKNLFDVNDGPVGKMLVGQVSKLGNLIGGDLGAKIAGGLANAIPGIGALLGPAVSALAGKLGSLLGGLFGKVSAEVKQARTDIAGFEEKLAGTLTTAQKIEAGGVGWKMTVIAVRDAYLAVGKTAAEAEAVVKALWDDKNPQKSKAAMEQINAVLEQQKTKFAELKSLQDELATLQEQNKVSFADMKTTAERFGIDLAKLGPAFNSARMAEKAKEIIDGFEIMRRGGADMGAVVHGMSDEISAFVQESLKLGTKVPENMRPMIEELIKNGELLDENGEKITDISKIPFGDPVASKFDLIAKRMEEVAKKIGELVDLLKVGLVDAAGTAAKGIEDKLNGIPKEWNFKVNVDGTEASADNMDKGYALGTMGRTGKWFKNFGAGTQTTLHGDEAVVRRDQAADFAAEMGGGNGGMIDAMMGLRADFAAMPQHIARAVRDAILVAG